MENQTRKIINKPHTQACNPEQPIYDPSIEVEPLGAEIFRGKESTDRDDSFPLVVVSILYSDGNEALMFGMKKTPAGFKNPWEFCLLTLL